MPPGLGGMRSQRRSSERAGVIEGGEGGLGDHGVMCACAIDARQRAGIEGRMILTLVQHPSSSDPYIESLEAEVWRPTPTRLRLKFVAEGDADHLRTFWPGACIPQRSDELWRRTCFEVFIREPSGEGYIELNMAPDGRWAAYRFDNYRAGMEPVEGVVIGYLEQHAWGHEYGLDLEIDLGRVVDAHLGNPLVLAVSAVLDHGGPSNTYWALTHPPGKPDFHHTDGFVLTLSPESP